jgi:predicted negative regulator of RcsB-dependent stress response
MSQKKVDQYKNEKKNRKEIMRKEKTTARIEILVAVLIFAALIGWFGFSVYQKSQIDKAANAEAVTTSLDLSAMDEFETTLNEYTTELENGGSDEAAADEESTDAAGEEAAAESEETTSGSEG